MTRWLVTFSGARYDGCTGKLVEQAGQYGADRVLVYDDVWLRAHGFYAANRWLWEHPGQRFPNGTYGRRGYGWYAWKALVMLEALEHAQPGDVLLYVDGDTVPVAPLAPIYEVAARDGAMFFAAQGHKQRTWCTRDCYLAMGMGDGSAKAQAAMQLAGLPGTPRERYYDVQAGVARFFAVTKGPWRPRQLLMEWLAYAVNPMTTTFDPSELLSHTDAAKHLLGDDVGVEHPGFEEHRTEQAIMTNLVHRYGYKLWRECDDSGEGYADDRDVYGQLFQQTRLGDGSTQGGSRYRNVPMPGTEAAPAAEAHADP